MLKKWRTYKNKCKTIKSLVIGKLYITRDSLIEHQEYKIWAIGVMPYKIPINSCVMIIDIKQDPNYTNYIILKVLHNNKIIPVPIRNKEFNFLLKPL